MNSATHPPPHGNDDPDQWNRQAIELLIHESGNPTSLNEAIRLFRRSLGAAPDGDLERARILSNLGTALGVLSERTGNLDALAEAVQAGRDAVAATPTGHPDRPGMLSNLRADLRALSERTGNLDALAEAVQAGRDALAATPTGHPDRPGMLSNLGAALQSLSERTGNLDALTEAVQAGRDAVAATPAGHPDRPGMLSNLASALRTTWEQTGDLDDLTEAVLAGREALAATPTGHPVRPWRLSLLGGALRALSEQTGDLDDLTEAVQAGREALAATPAGHPHRSAILSNLGAALWVLYERTGNLAALTEAIQAGRDAVAATPGGHPADATTLSNLGNALQSMFERTGNPEVLAEAVQAGREAVAAAPAGHPHRAGRLSNLGNALQSVFERTGDPEVLAEAVQAGRDAVAAAPAGHPDRAVYSANLGGALQALFERTGDLDALTEARDIFAEAATPVVAPARVRIRADRGLGRAAMSAGDNAGALAAYENAITLLPQMAPRRLSRRDREHGLGEVAGLPAEAASAAIAAGLPERAVELLEQARGVLLAEMMDARGDLSDLQVRAPALAARFTRLRDELDAADLASSDPGDPSPDALNSWLRAENEPQDGVTTGRPAPRGAARRIADRRQQLAQEWDNLLAEIRGMAHMEGFLLAPPISALQQQARDGPVVMVNVSEYRCDVLILTANANCPVRLVELPRLTLKDVFYQINRFDSATVASTGLSLGQRRRGQQEIRAVLGWLWDEITAPVLADLGLTGRPDPGHKWPRLWWCPIGEMAFLPLHAAGHYSSTDADMFDDDRTAEAPTVLDRVISSYTPTIRALEHARQDRGSIAAEPKGVHAGALIVAMPETQQVSALPAVQIEAKRVAELLPGSLILAGPQATRDAVIAGLPHHRIAHLACHGLSDQNDPASSRLLLYDHAVTPLTVTAISRLRMSDVDLAYLSACSTTGSSQNLADQAVHITAAFQLAGYQQVIGTLWPIGDAAAAAMAIDIYTHLTGNGTRPPRTERAAEALHHAIRRLRNEYPAVPALWAAHIHVGAA